MIQGSREARRRDEDEKAQTSSRLWSSTLKNPRIVRVSRTFGGKDRHSKVRTVRGLRDRRIRLSVPTAIQLYALQDKLGLNQPSKVVDWLIAAAQHAIDELPPLEMSMIILQASNDHQLAAAAAAAPQFPQVHATTANVVPQNYMFNYAAQGACSSINSGGDGLEAVLARSGKEKEAVKEASSCFPYYYHLERRLSGCSPRDHQNYPMPMFASSSMAAAREQESKQQYKYAGQMAAAGSAPEDDTSNPLRGTWNLHAAAFPNSMGLQQKSMKNLPRDHCESYIPRTSL